MIKKINISSPYVLIPAIVVTLVLLIGSLMAQTYVDNTRRVFIDGKAIVEHVSFNDIVLGVRYHNGRPVTQHRLSLQNVSGKRKPSVGLMYTLVQEFDGVISICNYGECLELSKDEELTALFVGVETNGEFRARMKKEDESVRFK